MSEQLLQPQGDPKIGMVLQEKYLIRRALGEGGMGAVYEAEHQLIKKRVAIKCLHQQFAQNAEIVARFHREAHATAKIGHPNIIEVTDMGRFPDGALFMVLEFLDGRDWAADIEREGAQPLGKVVRIVSQMCDALDAAHAEDIIHRDLKPENVYLVERGGNPDYVKVLDFGISKFKDSAGKGMTQTGTTMGTPYYMSPEQAQARKDIDHRADIYSMGVMMFQALTDQYPFDDESYPMLVLKICTEPAPSVLRYRPDLPAEIDTIINKLLSKSPGDRYNTCAELKAALAPFAEVMTVPRVDSQAPKTANMESSLLTQGQRMAAGAPMVVAAETQHPVTQKSKLGLWLALFSVLALGVSAAVAVALFKKPDPVVAPEVTEPAELAVAEAVPEVVPDVKEVSALGTIPITIVVDPADAEIYLDEKQILNPYDGQITPGEHSFRVSRRGYKTIEIKELNISQPQKINLKLKRGRGKDRSARRKLEKSTPKNDVVSVGVAAKAGNDATQQVVNYKDPRVDGALKAVEDARREAAEQARKEAEELRKLKEQLQQKKPEVVNPTKQKELKTIL